MAHNATPVAHRNTNSGAPVANMANYTPTNIGANRNLDTPMGNASGVDGSLANNGLGAQHMGGNQLLNNNQQGLNSSQVMNNQAMHNNQAMAHTPNMNDPSTFTDADVARLSMLSSTQMGNGALMGKLVPMGSSANGGRRDKPLRV